MPQQFVITITAVDRVGIVAGLSRAVLRLGGNIDALSQTVMRGYFTLIATVDLEDGISCNHLAATIREESDYDDLGVLVKERKGNATERPPDRSGETFILTMKGPDRPGIVKSITEYLAQHGVNIEDLYAQVKQDLFLLIAELHVPAEVDIGAVQDQLQKLWPGRDVELSFQHEDIFLATNQVEFSH